MIIAALSAPPEVRIKIIARVTRAAGSAILKLARNLSFIAHPCPLQAAMVVSEIKERLSPNIAPPITAPTHSGAAKPEAVDTARAIGVISVMVPTEVPMARETKQLTPNSTITAKRAGITERRKYATLSALSLPTTPTKMPATIKIRIMVTIFLSPTPCAITESFSSKLNLGFWIHATRRAVRNETTMGIL